MRAPWKVMRGIVMRARGLRINPCDCRKDNCEILNLEKCNFIKIVLMLSVIFYHSICYWSRYGWFTDYPDDPSVVLDFLCGYLNSIHVYGFAVISGYLFYYSKYEKGTRSSFFSSVIHRGKRLLWPYFATAAFWVAPFYCIYFGVNENTLIHKYVLAEAPSQLWFLVMLFTLFCLFSLLSDFFYHENAFWGIVISCSCYAIGLWGSRRYLNVFQIWTALKYIVFFYIGFYLRKKQNNFLYSIPWFAYFLVHLGSFLVVFYGSPSQKMGDVLTFVCNIAGALAVIMLLNRCDADKLCKHVLYQFMKRHNLVMYCFHQQLVYISLTLFSHKLPNPLLVVVNFVFATLVSGLIAVIISKLRICKTVYGYR